MQFFTIAFYILNQIYFIGNGKVDFNEFIDLMLELESPELDQRSYMDAFRAFDNTNRGYINSALIREILVDVMGQREKEIQHIINVFRLDKERKVSYEGILSLSFSFLIGRIAVQY